MMFEALDRQLARHVGRLTEELHIESAVSQHLASAIGEELSSFGFAVLDALGDGEPVDFKTRCDELSAFQGFMDATRPSFNDPIVARARVLVQNYMCFVYIKEAWLERLREKAFVGGPLHACSTFLTTGKVRAFRNAVSHAQWRYMADFSGIVYWDRAEPRKPLPLLTYGVEQDELDFWQALTRAIAYVTVTVGLEARRRSRSSIM